MAHKEVVSTGGCLLRKVAGGVTTGVETTDVNRNGGALLLAGRAELICPEQTAVEVQGQHERVS